MSKQKILNGIDQQITNHLLCIDDYQLDVNVPIEIKNSEIENISDKILKLNSIKTQLEKLLM